MNSVGYARVSTGDQDHAMQREALTAAGCVKIFSETASGALRERPELARLLEYLRPGDTLIVWKLDRLGRSIQHLIEVVTTLAERDIGFRSLTEGFDTTTPGGKLLFHVLGALAQFERDLIRERTMAGLATARAAGRTGGRRPKLTQRQLEMARQMHDSGTHTITAIADVLNVARSTVYRALDRDAPDRTLVQSRPMTGAWTMDFACHVCHEQVEPDDDGKVQVEGVSHVDMPKAWVWGPVVVHDQCRLRVKTPFDDRVGGEYMALWERVTP